MATRRTTKAKPSAKQDPIDEARITEEEAEAAENPPPPDPAPDPVNESVADKDRELHDYEIQEDITVALKGRLARFKAGNIVKPAAHGPDVIRTLKNAGAKLKKLTKK